MFSSGHTLVLNGDTDQVISDNDGPNTIFNNLRVNKSTGTVYLETENLYVLYDLIITQGTLSTGDSTGTNRFDIDVNRDITIGGTLDVPSATGTSYVNCGRNWDSSSGTFNHNGWGVILDGSGTTTLA